MLRGLLNSPGVVILGGGGLVRGLLFPLRRIVTLDSDDWVQRLVQLGRGVAWWIVILGPGFGLGHLLALVGVGVLVWGLNLDTGGLVPGLHVSGFGFLLFLALGVRRREDLYFRVFFLGLNLFVFATFADLLVFVSFKLGHAVAVLACAAVIPEEFFALPAASNSFLSALLCLGGVLPPGGCARGPR